MARPLMADHITTTEEAVDQPGALPAESRRIDECDSLADDLIGRDPSFREMLARSAASPRREFRPLDPDHPSEGDD